jgi:hypothetical protein
VETLWSVEEREAREDRPMASRNGKDRPNCQEGG